MNDVEEYPNQKYGWVKENDGSWSLYAPDGTKVIGTAGNKVQVPTPVGTTDATTKAYVDASGGGGSLPVGWTQDESGRVQTNGGFIRFDLDTPGGFVVPNDGFVLENSDISFNPGGNMVMGDQQLTGLPAPFADSDAATKKYVDDGLALGVPDTAYTSEDPPTLSQGNVTAVFAGGETRWKRMGRTIHVRTWVQVVNGTTGEAGEYWMLELPIAVPAAENSGGFNGPVAAGSGYVNAGPSVAQLPVNVVWSGDPAARTLIFVAPSGALGSSTGTDLQMLDGSEVQIGLVYEAATSA